MTTKWKVCTDPEELFRLKREGLEVEYCTIYGGWAKWDAATWNGGTAYRCRPPQPKMKTITLRKALIEISHNTFSVVEGSSQYFGAGNFVCWLGEPYTVEVPE